MGTKNIEVDLLKEKSELYSKRTIILYLVYYTYEKPTTNSRMLRWLD